MSAWALPLLGMVLAQIMAAWALLRNRPRSASAIALALALLSSALCLRQMSFGAPPGFGLQPLELFYLAGNGLCAVLSLFMLAARRGGMPMPMPMPMLKAGRRVGLVLWGWNTLSVALLIFLTTSFRLFS